MCKAFEDSRGIILKKMEKLERQDIFLQIEEQIVKNVIFCQVHFDIFYTLFNIFFAVLLLTLQLLGL